MAGNLMVVLCVVAVSVLVCWANDRYRARLTDEEQARVRRRDRRACLILGGFLGAIVLAGAYLDFMDH